MADFRVESHKDEVLKEMEEAIAQALETIGLVAEGYAKRLCAVDTGLLRNSITHAISGESPAITEYKSDKGDEKGSYSGSIGSKKEPAVYIGTNVEYAPYLEMGTSRTGPQPYLKPAVMDHLDEYKDIVEKALKS